MELTKNIFFNTDKLVENTTVKISYTGELFQNDSKEVSIHYGFGLNWEDVNDIPMEKTELGFQAEITLTDADSFNFCFKNENDQWDNNNGTNYIFPIEKTVVALTETNIDELAMMSPRRLRKSYIWSKKIRLAVYKLITYIPRIISGNYKRKVADTNSNN